MYRSILKLVAKTAQNTVSEDPQIILLVWTRGKYLCKSFLFLPLSYNDSPLSHISTPVDEKHYSHTRLHTAILLSQVPLCHKTDDTYACWATPYSGTKHWK